MTDQPSDRPSACCHQLTAVKTGYPLTSITWLYRGLRCGPIKVEYFLMLSADNLFVFNWLQAHVYFFLNSYQMSVSPRTITILTSNWPQTQKFNQFFRNTGGKDLFLPWSHVGHAPRPVLMLWLVKIWRVSSRVKFMQHLQSCLLWRLRLTEFWVNLWCF